MPRLKTRLLFKERYPRSGKERNSEPGNHLQIYSFWVYRSQRLTFPPEIAATNLRPDLVLLFKSCRRVFIVELSVPWEDALNEAFERKKLRFANLATEGCWNGGLLKILPQQRGAVTGCGWSTKTQPGLPNDHVVPPCNLHPGLISLRWANPNGGCLSLE